jgi:eukaryotic-like serine/threonine-protein kinase
VAAAIDLRRAGYTAPIPRAVLGQVQEQYLTGPEHGRTPREPLPEAWQRASGPAEATSLADAARAQGRYSLAEYAYRHAYSARGADPELSAEHPDTLTSRSNLALVLRDLGRPC